MMVGVLVKDFGPSQLTYQLARGGQGVGDIIAFFENSSRHSFPLPFASMPIHEAFSYTGICIATNLSTALKLLSYPRPSKKYFYVWDLEWMRIANRDYDKLASIYRNESLQLIARSVSHAEIISKCWNVDKVEIMRDFDLRCLVKNY
jgi:hypothetical protein